jgi:hypothetical protein
VLIRVSGCEHAVFRISKSRSPHGLFSIQRFWSGSTDPVFSFRYLQGLYVFLSVDRDLAVLAGKNPCNLGTDSGNNAHQIWN